MGQSFSLYGVSAPAAVDRLLTDACRSNGRACYDLAAAHESGYFGPIDLAVARIYYGRGAELGDRMSWEALARFLRDGMGGPVDQTRAYFWVSLEALCVDPRSGGGQDTWKVREALAETLGLEVLEHQWTAVDAYMAEYHAGKRQIYSDPFLGTAIHESLRKQGEREANKREQEHRASLRRAKGPLER